MGASAPYRRQRYAKFILLLRSYAVTTEDSCPNRDLRQNYSIPDNAGVSAAAGQGRKRYQDRCLGSTSFCQTRREADSQRLSLSQVSSRNLQVALQARI